MIKKKNEEKFKFDKEKYYVISPEIKKLNNMK